MDRVAVITGGSRGLGLATAKELQARGFKLLLVGLETKLTQSALRQLTDRPEVQYVSGDITTAVTAGEIAQVCRERFARCDLLVNNAGIFLAGKIEEFDEASWDRIISVNLKGPYMVTRALIELLKESKGQIIFINSVGGRQGLTQMSGYSASKFGLTGLADSLRLELKPHHIRVTSIFPNNMNSIGEVISAADSKRNHVIEPHDVARLIGEVADAPPHMQIPEIQVYPLSTEIHKSERHNL